MCYDHVLLCANITNFVGGPKFTKALQEIQIMLHHTWAIPEPISPPPMTVTWLNAFALCALVAKERTKLLHRLAITSLFFWHSWNVLERKSVLLKHSAINALFFVFYIRLYKHLNNMDSVQNSAFLLWFDIITVSKFNIFSGWFWSNIWWIHGVYIDRHTCVLRKIDIEGKTISPTLTPANGTRKLHWGV